MIISGHQIDDALELDDGFTVADAIIAAIEAEREMCAKIADQMRSGLNQNEIVTSEYHSRKIATAIRARR